MEIDALPGNSQPGAKQVLLVPKLVQEWLREQFKDKCPDKLCDARTFLEEKAGRKLSRDYVRSCLYLVYGFNSWLPSGYNEPYRTERCIGAILTTALKAKTPVEICEALGAGGVKVNLATVLQSLRAMQGKGLVECEGELSELNQKDTKVTLAVGSNGQPKAVFDLKEPQAVQVTRFLIEYHKEFKEIASKQTVELKLGRISPTTYSCCVRAVAGQSQPHLITAEYRLNRPVGNQTPYPKATRTVQPPKNNPSRSLSGQAAQGGAENPAAQNFPTVETDPFPEWQNTLSELERLLKNKTSSTNSRDADEMASVEESERLWVPAANWISLVEYDPVSQLVWFRQRTFSCLEASLWNLLGVPWVLLPAPGKGLDTAAGELVLACEVEPGQARTTPINNFPIKQLFVPQRMLGALAQGLADLKSGFVLYLGETSREATQHQIAGHYVAMRRENGQWYLIDSLGGGPVKTNLAEYLRKLPHGLMAAIPVTTDVATSQIWLTLEAMAKNPRLESLSLILNFDRTPQDILTWLTDEGLGPNDLSQAEVVVRYLNSITGQSWGWEAMKLPDTQAAQPWRTENQSHFGQGNNASGQGQGSNPVDTLLQKLDASGRDLCVLCLKAPPFHLLTYRRDGNWFCEIEPPSAPGQDIYSPGLVKQPLREVLERYLAEVVARQAELTPAGRNEADAVAQRTKVDVLWQESEAVQQ